MSRKRRTRKEKTIARLRRQLLAQARTVSRQRAQKTKARSKIQPPLSDSISNQPASPAPNQIYFYDPILIKRDLKKTVVYSFFLTLLLLVLFWYLEKGGYQLAQTLFLKFPVKL